MQTFKIEYKRHPIETYSRTIKILAPNRTDAIRCLFDMEGDSCSVIAVEYTPKLCLPEKV